jgi:hypothetical protein
MQLVACRDESALFMMLELRGVSSSHEWRRDDWKRAEKGSFYFMQGFSVVTSAAEFAELMS